MLAWLHGWEEAWARVPVQLNALNVNVTIVRWTPELEEYISSRSGVG